MRGGKTLRLELEKIFMLIENFEKRNNTSITLRLNGDGSGSVEEFWEQDELKTFDNKDELIKVLAETQFELDENGLCYNPPREL